MSKDVSIITAVTALMMREVGLWAARGAGPLVAAAFFLTLTALFPLSIGPDAQVLKQGSAGLSWLCLALTSLLSLERLFERDYDEGVFEMLQLGPVPLELICLIKSMAQWVVIGPLLALLTPFVMIAFGTAPHKAFWAFFIALLGSLSFSMWGGLGAALGVGLRKGGAFMAVLVLPFYLPPVIFGAVALGDSAQSTQGLLLLGAFCLFSLALCPLFSALCLRNALR